MLYILAGLPGTGKTTLARHIARTRKALHVRIDTIEQALREAGLSLNGPEGYVVGFRLASENLCLACDVVADSVNPLTVTRTAWREVALHAGVRSIEIEVICSDANEHRARIESRVADIPRQPPLSWHDVLTREYAPWATPRHVIDTARKGLTETALELDHMLAR